jgi:hypothetical protein
MAVLTEAVYQEGHWRHTACHRAGVSQLLQATWLADVFTADKRGMEIITSPLFQEMIRLH